MKITDIEFYITNPGNRNYTFLRVLTDEGISGVGAPYNVGPDNGVIGALEDMKEWFIGQDPTRKRVLISGLLASKSLTTRSSSS